MAYYLRTLGGRPELWDGSELVYKQLQTLVLLAYLERTGEQTRTELATTFWPNHDKQAGLKRLSETFRLLEKAAPGTVQKSKDGKLVKATVFSDINEIRTAVEQESFELIPSLYKDHYLQTVEHNKRLGLADNPNLYDWLLSERERVADLSRDAILKQAELEAARENYKNACKLALKALGLRTEQSFLLPRTYERIYTLLLCSDAAQSSSVAKEAIHLYGAEALELHKDKTTARAALCTPNNLPQLADDLLGRSAELEESTALLKTKTRLLAFTGPPGIGKTHLGTVLSRNLRGYSAFKDGIFVIWLEALNHADDVPPVLAKVLGLSVPSSREPLDFIAESIATQSLLLYFDNAEHLPELARLLDTLLPRCPNLRLLLSSREVIASDWAHTYFLEGLAYPHEDEHDVSPEAALSYPAIKLFVEQGKKANPAFKLNEDNLPHALKLCQQVKGLPLALKLAASWLGASSVKAIKDSLEQNLDVLDEVQSNQRGISAAIDLSCQRLSKKEQEAFVKLSVFEGGFTLGAGKAVTGISLTTLRNLKNKSLLEWQGDTKRYSFHPLIHQFAREKLQTRSEQKVGEAHSQHYLAQLRLTTEGTQEEKNNAPRNLAHELNNIDKAWNYALETKQEAIIDETAYALCIYCHISANAHKGLELIEKAMNTFDEKSKSRAMLMATKAWLSYVVGNYEEAKSVAKNGLQIAQKLSATIPQVYCLETLGASTGSLGLYKESISYFSEILPLVSDDSGEFANSLGNIASSQTRLGLYDMAINNFQQALAVFQLQNKPAKIINIQLGMTKAINALQNFQISLNLLNEALTKTRELNIFYWIPQIYSALGETYLMSNNDILAQKFIDKGLVEAENLKQPLTQADLYLLHAKLCLQNQQLESAEESIGLSLNTSLTFFDKRRILKALLLILEYLITIQNMQNINGVVTLLLIHSNRLDFFENQHFQTLRQSFSSSITAKKRIESSSFLEELRRVVNNTPFALPK